MQPYTVPLQLHAHDELCKLGDDVITQLVSRTANSCFSYWEVANTDLSKHRKLLPSSCNNSEGATSWGWISHSTPPLLFLSQPDIVHENLKMGSDGESDQTSGTSSDEVQSPTDVCLRNRGNRRISAEVAHPRRPPPPSFPTQRSPGSDPESLREGQSRSLFLPFFSVCVPLTFLAVLLSGVGCQTPLGSFSGTRKLFALFCVCDAIVSTFLLSRLCVCSSFSAQYCLVADKYTIQLPIAP